MPIEQNGALYNRVASRIRPDNRTTQSQQDRDKERFDASERMYATRVVRRGAEVKGELPTHILSTNRGFDIRDRVKVGREQQQHEQAHGEMRTTPFNGEDNRLGSGGISKLYF